MKNDKYFSRAWALLTRDKGWFKPLLVMTAASLVPVAGALGNKGYVLEWSRLVAWGVDAAPKQKNVDVGKCISSGWRGFVVDLGLGLGYALVLSLAMGVATMLPGFLGGFVSGLLSVASIVLSGCVAVFLMIAEIRAAIYERIGAGYRLDRIMDMIKSDLSGFGKLFLIYLAILFVTAITGTIVSIVVVLELMPVMISASAYDQSAVMMALAGSFVWIMLTCVLLGLIVSFVANGASMVIGVATALWMRQFDVPSWGRSEDPLPNVFEGVRDESNSAPRPIRVVPMGLPEEAEQEPSYNGGQASEDGQSVEPEVAIETESVLEDQPTAVIELGEATKEEECASGSEPFDSLALDMQPEFDAPVKDVDQLYADLRDVISRNDHTSNS